jgi:hypothetical protein
MCQIRDQPRATRTRSHWEQREQEPPLGAKMEETKEGRDGTEDAGLKQI